MILVFGSLNADFILPVKNFPAPSETVLTRKAVVKAGGKGANQAAAAARAGGLVKMFGAVGRDEVSKVPLTALKAQGVDCSGVHATDLSTGMAMIMLDERGENSIVVAGGANTVANADFIGDAFLTDETLVAMQMEVPPDENFKLLRRAKAKGAKTLLNVAPAAPIPSEILPLIDYLILNEIEADAVGKHLFDAAVSDPSEKAARIARKTGGACLITLGAKGVVGAQDQKTFAVDALKLTPVDTTGAGDAFVGIFAAMIDGGLDIVEAARHAAAGAGLACLKVGAQEALPSFKEIETRVEEIAIRQFFMALREKPL